MNIIPKQYMQLNIYVNNDTNTDTTNVYNNELKEKYIAQAEKHNNNILNEFPDSGFDLLSPKEIEMCNKTVNKLNYNIICSATIVNNELNDSYNTGYYLYPRSSISKTPLRLANNVGIIDSGYRGNIIGMFDKIYDNTNAQNTSLECYIVNKYDRLLQICAPNLIPIKVSIVNNLSDLSMNTNRGTGGFGSTGR
jgi:dUTP pyrophosphatase